MPKQRKVTRGKSADKAEVNISCRELGKADHEGWLSKKAGGHGLVPITWKRYWCVVKDSKLYLYKTAFDIAADYLIQVKEYTVESINEKKRIAFCMKPVGDQLKPVVFAGATEDEVKKWMEIIGKILSGVEISQKDDLNVPDYEERKRVFSTSSASPPKMPTGKRHSNTFQRLTETTGMPSSFAARSSSVATDRRARYGSVGKSQSVLAVGSMFSSFEEAKDSSELHRGSTEDLLYKEFHVDASEKNGGKPSELDTLLKEVKQLKDGTYAKTSVELEPSSKTDPIDAFQLKGNVSEINPTDCALGASLEINVSPPHTEITDTKADISHTQELSITEVGHVTVEPVVVEAGLDTQDISTTKELLEEPVMVEGDLVVGIAKQKTTLSTELFYMGKEVHDTSDVDLIEITITDEAASEITISEEANVISLESTHEENELITDETNAALSSETSTDEGKVDKVLEISVDNASVSENPTIDAPKITVPCAEKSPVNETVHINTISTEITELSNNKDIYQTEVSTSEDRSEIVSLESSMSTAVDINEIVSLESSVSTAVDINEIDIEENLEMPDVIDGETRVMETELAEMRVGHSENVADGDVRHMALEDTECSSVAAPKEDVPENLLKGYCNIDVIGVSEHEFEVSISTSSDGGGDQLDVKSERTLQPGDLAESTMSENEVLGTISDNVPSEKVSVISQEQCTTNDASTENKTVSLSHSSIENTYLDNVDQDVNIYSTSFKTNTESLDFTPSSDKSLLDAVIKASLGSSEVESVIHEKISNGVIENRCDSNVIEDSCNGNASDKETNGHLSNSITSITVDRTTSPVECSKLESNSVIEYI